LSVIFYLSTSNTFLREYARPPLQNDFSVKVTSDILNKSKELSNILEMIDGKIINSPKIFPLKSDYLEVH